MENISKEVNLREVSKTTKFRSLKNLAKNVQLQKQPHLSCWHNKSRLQRTKKVPEHRHEDEINHRWNMCYFERKGELRMNSNITFFLVVSRLAEDSWFGREYLYERFSVFFECLHVLNHVCSTLTASWVIFDSMPAWLPPLKTLYTEFSTW